MRKCPEASQKVSKHIEELGSVIKCQEGSSSNRKHQENYNSNMVGTTIVKILKSLGCPNKIYHSVVLS